MTKAQFMYELMSSAEALPDEEKFSLMGEYDRYFDEKRDEGMTDGEIIASLPSPSDIAKGAVSRPDASAKGNSANRAAPLGVLLFVLLIPVFIVYEALIFVLFLFLTVLLLALCVAAAFGSVAAFGVSPLSHGFILLGVGGMLVTVALVMLSAAYFKGAGRAFSWFPQMMGRTLRSEKGAAH